jgi:3-oxoacyl-[acyl-carrier-protein] synthase II
VVVGTAHGAGASVEQSARSVAAKGKHGLSPLAAPTAMTSSIAAGLAMRYGFEGRCLTVCTACAAGADAIGVGTELLRSGAADLVLAGGVEAPLYLTSVIGFGRTGATTRSPVPEGASKPFDRDRDGFVLSEGSAFVALQRSADAAAAGARVEGLVLGYASTCDAFHISAPRKDGRCVRDCIELALADARIGPDDVDHVNAHGTSTLRNDLAEGRMIEQMYGRAAPPVTAVKGATGHLIGASGALEAIVTLRTLRHSLVPPVAGHRVRDPGFDIDVVTAEPRKVDAELAVSHSFGFGGANAVLVFGRG